MATIQDRQWTQEYSGLLSNLYVGLVVTGICGISSEIMRQVRRRRGNPNRCKQLGDSNSRDSWEFGYLYQARAWSSTPSPMLPRWPLLSLWQAYRFPEEKMPALIGVDHTVHVRFLRACFYFSAIHVFTTLPVLLPIHLVYAPSYISKTSMLRASLSSLIDSQSAQKYLWVHLTILLWMMVTWVVILLWFSWGSLQYRRRNIESTLQAAKTAQIQSSTSPTAAAFPFNTSPDSPSLPLVTPDQKPIRNLGPRAWRWRSIMVSNIPPDMRDVKILREYFEDGIERSNILSSIRHQTATSLTLERRLAEDEEELVTEVVLVRRLLELEKLRGRRTEVLKKLEEAHVGLVRNVMGAVEKEMTKNTWKGFWGKSGFIGGVPMWVPKMTEVDAEKGLVSSLEKNQTEGEETEAGKGDGVQGMSDDQKMAFLVDKLGRFLKEDGREDHVGSKENLNGGQDDDKEDQTIWEVLHSIPRPLLDAHQPLYYSRLSASLLRKHNPPQIDYFTPKLNLLSSLIEEHRSQPIESFSAASTAFVTFRSPEIARGVIKKMPSHPKKTLACSVEAAPDYRDLEWVRLMKKRYRTEFFKGWVVAIGVWAFIIFWIIPITLLVGLVSVTNLATIFPHIQEILDRHPRASEVVTSLLPTLLVSGLTLLIPLLLFLISKNAETIVTKSQLHNILLSRYYKFLMCNVVIFFCIGVSSLKAFVTSFREDLLSINILKVIASAFPQAAPFYAGWLILQTGLHSFIEYLLLGLPLITYLGLRKAQVPRRRNSGTEPRYFSDAYWKPLHILCLSITVLFAILNPLVLPFGLVYFAVALPIFKNQMIHVYQHQYETQGLRPVIRFVRYSLDGHALAQIVFMAMMVILKKKALIGLTVVMIIITLALKIVLTRAIKSRFRVLEISEAEGLHHFAQGYPSTVGPRPSFESIGSPLPHQEINEGPIYPSMESLPSMIRVVRDFSGGRNHPVPSNEWRFSSLPARGSVTLPFPFEHKPLPFETSSIRASASWSERFLSVPSRLLVAPVLSRFDAHYFQEFRVDSTSDEEEGLSQATADQAALPSPNGPAFSKADQEESMTVSQQRSQVVVRTHPPPAPWTDHPNDSRTFGYQPAYADDLDCYLWLPKHPLRTLDLDDTLEINRALESSCGGSGRIGSWGTDQFGDFCPTVLSSSDEVIEEVASFIEGRLNEDEAKEENDLGRRVSVKSAFGLQPSLSMVLTADPTEDVTETPLCITPEPIPSVSTPHFLDGPHTTSSSSPPPSSFTPLSRARARTMYGPRKKPSSPGYPPARHFSLSRADKPQTAGSPSPVHSPQRPVNNRSRSSTQHSTPRENVLQLIAAEELAAARRDRAEETAILDEERNEGHSRFLRRLGLVNRDD